MKVSLQCYNSWFWILALIKYTHMQHSIHQTKVHSTCSPLYKLLDPTSVLPASLTEAVEAIRPQQNQINNKMFPEIDYTRPHDLNINVWNKSQCKETTKPWNKHKQSKSSKSTNQKNPKPKPVPVLCLHVPKCRKPFHRMTSIKLEITDDIIYLFVSLFFFTFSI